MASRVQCPSAGSLLASASRPVLTSSCPSRCTAYGVCAYYPTGHETQCVATTTQPCRRGDTCAFQCLGDSDTAPSSLILTLYSRRDDVLDQVAQSNVAHPDSPQGIAYDVSQIDRWVGAISLVPRVTTLFIAGNEDANNARNAEPWRDVVSSPNGDVLPFQLPSSLFHDAQRLVRFRIENIKIPDMPSDATAELAFPLLTTLLLRNTMLTTFPLANASLPALQFLDVSVNNLTQFTAVELPDFLFDLNLSTNALTKLDKDSIPSGLTILDVSDNAIASIPKGTLPTRLQQLVLDRNLLTVVPSDIADMRSLIKLSLSGNNLGELPASVFPPRGVESLNIANCSLTAIPPSLKSWTALKELVFVQNDLSRDPDFSVLPKTLQQLDISDCKLQELPAALTRMQSLVSLSLRKNPEAVTDLTAIPATLRQLVLSENALDSVPKELRGLPLERLNLDSNPLGQLRVGSLPATLQAISMSNATFRTLAKGTLPSSIRELNMSESALAELPEDIRAMQNLSQVILTNCELESFDVGDTISSTARIDLRDNRITRFSGTFPSLVSLDLRHNAIQDFHLNGASSLQFLQLAENSLTAFPESIFKMQNLQLLNISFNPIRGVAWSRDQLAWLDRIPFIALDQEMFSTDCDVSNRIVFREYRVCASVIPPSSIKTWTWLVPLNIGLVIVLGLLVWAVWRRRRLQKQSLEDLAVQQSSLEKQQHLLTEACVWVNDALLQNRLDNALVERKRLLGSGMFGEVWLATYKNEQLALKQLRRVSANSGGADRTMTNAFVEEINLLSTLKHPRVVQFVGVVWTEESDLAMLTEYMDGGDLRSYLDYSPKQQRGWTTQMARIALHVAEAIVYLHSLDPIVIHRDIKSRNVLLDSMLQIKVSDFGLSRYKIEHDKTMTGGVGTVRWMAPEVLLGRRYNESIDIYSLGVIISEIDTSLRPFENSDEPHLTEARIAGMLMAGTINVAVSESCPPEIRSLVERSTARDPAERPSALQVAYELRLFLKSLATRRDG